jgi:LPS-assembly lipoprotein
MSWSRRAALAALAALGAVLAGCGFAPLDGPGGPGAIPPGGIAVAPLDTADGFVLVGRLEERLGRPGPAADRRLSVSLTLAQEAMALTTDSETDRFNLIGRADWRLDDAATGAILARGTARDFTAWSATASTVATLAAERDARRRLACSLADAIVAELTLALAAR